MKPTGVPIHVVYVHVWLILYMYVDTVLIRASTTANPAHALKKPRLQPEAGSQRNGLSTL